jgi:2-C-methyl-D-erythritol 4-phosphate cytidylyltransferase/2-C-methyl-D-erythritol 2,4-cyclodiphosphate synthase
MARSRRRTPRAAVAVAAATTGAGRWTRRWAIVVAGGRGARLGEAAPKAFVSLRGEPLLTFSLRTLLVHDAISDVMVVLPRGQRELYERTVLRPLRRDLGPQARKLAAPVVGGRRRQDSVQAGLAAAQRLTGEPEAEHAAVLVHDAARPLLTTALVDRLLERLAAACGRGPGVAGVVPVLPVDDTLKTALGAPVGRHRARLPLQVGQTVPREGLWRVQTPQAFCLAPLIEAFAEAERDGVDVTDDAMVFERKGWPVETVAGDPMALKVTYPEDLTLLEAWLARAGGEPAARSRRGAGDGPVAARLRRDRPGGSAVMGPPA